MKVVLLAGGFGSRISEESVKILVTRCKRINEEMEKITMIIEKLRIKNYKDARGVFKI